MKNPFPDRVIQIQCLLTLALLLPTAIHAEDLAISTDRTNGVYEVGETVHWRVDWIGTNPAPSLRYKFLAGGRTVIEDTDLILSNNTAGLTTTFTEPGTMLLAVVSTNKARWAYRDGGVVAAPEQIKLSAARPKDFDLFWQAKVAELKKIPANPRLERVEVTESNLSYWKVTLDNTRSTHIQGQLARPTEGKKFPALLIVQWAGVYGLEKGWVTDRAKAGWLAFNISAHDLPIDHPKEFYKEQSAGPLTNYPAIGNDDRETSYFLRMYLSCYQALEYLTQRNDWDGKTLVVMGGSQGGLQTLMLPGCIQKKSRLLSPMCRQAAICSARKSGAKAAGPAGMTRRTESRMSKKSTKLRATTTWRISRL